MDYAALADLAIKLGSKYGKSIGDAGQVLGAQQGGANNARVAQGGLDNNRNRNVIDLYGAQQHAQDVAAQTDLQRQEFASKNRASTAHEALIGALIGGGITPTSISGGHASGGLLQSLNGNPQALQAMRTLAAQGSQAQNTPLSFQGGQMVKPPTLAAMPTIDTGNGTLGTMTKLAQLYGAVSPLLKNLHHGVDPNSGEASS